jgi:hypothetical protein
MLANHVADGHDVHVVESKKTAHITAALTTHANAAHHNPVVGSSSAGMGPHQQRSRGCNGRTGAEEAASIENNVFRHRVFS